MEENPGQSSSSPFRSTNRIRFDVAVDEAAEAWWRSEFKDLTPEGVGDLLSASWGGDKQMTVTELDLRDPVSLALAQAYISEVQP